MPSETFDDVVRCSDVVDGCASAIALSSLALPTTSDAAKVEYMPSETIGNVVRCSDVVGVLLELSNSFVAMLSLLTELGIEDPFR